jgi:hypothetical protein
MNVQKHMELIFISVLAAIGLGTLVAENLPEDLAKTSLPVARNIGTPTSMAVVVIRAPGAKEHI